MAEGDARTSKTTAAEAPRPRGETFGKGFLYDIWYFAALGSDLKPGKLQRYEIMGQPILLGRERSGAVYALRDICPHRAAPLSAGKLLPGEGGAEMVECPYHGWRFRTDGSRQSLPRGRTGDGRPRTRVRRYPSPRARGWCSCDGIDAGQRAEARHRCPGRGGGRPKLVDRVMFDAHIDQAVVGLMDPAHGPYVHRQWWWRAAGSEHDKAKRFEPREQGFTMVRHAPSSNSRAYAVLGGRPATEISFRLPGLRWEHVTVGKRQVLSLTCLTPIDENRTQVTQIAWSDHPAVTLLGPVLAAWARTFLRQDAGMVRLQARGLQGDPALLWVDDADRQAKWYQALKREHVASRREGRAFVNPVEPATLRWRS